LIPDLHHNCTSGDAREGNLIAQFIQILSTLRVGAGETPAPAYSLDVYGKPLEATVTNLRFVKGFVISKGVEIKYQLPPTSPALDRFAM